jgi:hypothetical protein
MVAMLAVVAPPNEAVEKSLVILLQCSCSSKDGPLQRRVSWHCEALRERPDEAYLRAAHVHLRCARVEPD